MRLVFMFINFGIMRMSYTSVRAWFIRCKLVWSFSGNGGVNIGV